MSMKIFVYKVKIDGETKHVAVGAENGTTANDGIRQQFGDLPVTYVMQLDMFMQVQGNVVIDGKATVLSDPPQPNESDMNDQN